MSSEALWNRIVRSDGRRVVFFSLDGAVRSIECPQHLNIPPERVVGVYDARITLPDLEDDIAATRAGLGL